MKQNISLLVKWWCKLDTQEELWQDIVKVKYLKRDTVATMKSKFNDSPIWKDIMKVKEYYFASRRVILKSGNIVRPWLIMWIMILLCEHDSLCSTTFVMIKRSR